MSAYCSHCGEARTAPRELAGTGPRRQGVLAACASRWPRYNTATVGHAPRQSRDVRAPGVGADDLRFVDLFEETQGDEFTGECTPPMDVLEVSDGIEILMDVSGVKASDLRLMFTGGTVVVAGRKLPGTCAHREAVFHLAERSFGRFVRAVRVSGAVDAGRASATLVAGELRIRLPRRTERRGQQIRIPLEPA